jgi:hypothetical protein
MVTRIGIVLGAVMLTGLLVGCASALYDARAARRSC